MKKLEFNKPKYRLDGTILDCECCPFESPESCTVCELNRWTMGKYIQYSKLHPNTLFLSDDAKVVLEDILREMKESCIKNNLQLDGNIKLDVLYGSITFEIK